MLPPFKPTLKSNCKKSLSLCDALAQYRKLAFRCLPSAPSTAMTRTASSAAIGVSFRHGTISFPDASASTYCAFHLPTDRHGAMAKVSSIHVNGWFGDYDKLTTSKEFLKAAFEIEVDVQNSTIVFAGDSPNDAPMFAFFQNSVGVANVRDFEGQMPANPSWVTPGRGATGFAELAAALLVTR